jgi:hypothetical protein
MRIKTGIVLLLVSSGIFSQVRKTDERIITEEMRYSSEKKFNTWALTVGYGPLVMYSDVTDYTYFPKGQFDFAPSVILSKQLFPSLALDLQYLSGKMNGEYGPHYFKGDFHEGSLSAVLFLNQITASPGPINDKWNLYIKAGAGATFFRSRLHFVADDEPVRDSDIGGGSERFMVTGYDPNDPYKKIDRRMEIMVPLTAGLMYRLNKSFDLAWETSMRFCASDNLDNILTGSTNDRYLFSGLHLSYKIGKKDKRHMRWTYRGYGFNLFGRPKKDPMIKEISELEDQINTYKAGRPIRRDSVLIQESLITMYETTYVRTIFFNNTSNYTFDIEDQVLMAEAVVQMKQNPGTALEVYGHVPVEDAGDAMETSKQQCEKVVDFLVNELGADAKMITIFPMGNQSPITGEGALSSQVQRMANRRVDMIFKR